jgi:UDP-3-O-[3-hydroxymyristoyl] glucosamine N-acyltransferase
MTDRNFHIRARAFSLDEIARVSGADLNQKSSADFLIEDVAPLDRAGASDLTFFDNIRYREQFKKTKAGACFVRPEFVADAPKNLNLLITDNPYKSYALAAQAIYPDAAPAPKISPHAHIHDGAVIGKNCLIEDGVIIFPGATIGAHCRIEAGAVIRENVRIGDHCRIGSNTTISHSIIGSHVRIYPGACIGHDGFGFAIDPAGPVKIPQLGRVIIHDNVEIGANAAIDRGAGPDTVIGHGTWIDNLVHIGHNVEIGKYCIIAGQTGFSGSVVVGDGVAMGGQVGISGHLKIGSRARIAAQSGVIGDVPAGAEVMGYPAQPKRQYLKGIALLNRLIKTSKSS